MVMNLKINGNESKSKSIERLHLCTASLLLFSSLLQNLNSTELDRIGLNRIEPETKPNQIELDQGGRDLHPGNVEHPGQPLVQLVHPPALLGEPDHHLGEHLGDLGDQPGHPGGLLEGGKTVEEK